MQVKIHHSLVDIDSTQWNSLLASDQPLLRHEFLLAMETHGCVGEHFGWQPCHVAVYEDNCLRAAMPLYSKTNSYGEFVFDHAWANAYQQSGMAYYPKLVSAVPYTPAGGQRILCADNELQRFQPVLLQAVQQIARDLGQSGFHCLFARNTEIELFAGQGLLLRHDCQFHWHNRGYADFDGYLAAMTSRKRKNIRRERQAVIDAGISFRQLDGHTAQQQDWADFTRFYNRTFEEKWGMATFNQAFFEDVAQNLPDNILLVLADRNDQCIAGALMYRDKNCLYGRHWGCDEQVDHLHFETCYYQGIDFCIANGLSRFEPGAQGEHKLARGFEPTLTRSAHWLTEDVYQRPIAQFCEHEQRAVMQYIRQMQANLPFKSATPSSGLKENSA